MDWKFGSTATDWVFSSTNFTAAAGFTIDSAPTTVVRGASYSLTCSNVDSAPTVTLNGQTVTVDSYTTTSINITIPSSIVVKHGASRTLSVTVGGTAQNVTVTFNPPAGQSYVDLINPIGGTGTVFEGMTLNGSPANPQTGDQLVYKNVTVPSGYSVEFDTEGYPIVDTNGVELTGTDTIDIYLISDGLSNTSTITIQDYAAEAPAMPADTAIGVNEGNTSVGTFTATSGTGTISYSISGTDSSFFTINSSTGQLSFLSAPDFETPQDSDSNNSYVVIVTATNSAGSDSQIITVNVQDVMEEVAPTMAADTSVNINENTTSVGTFAIVSGSTPVTYSISGTDSSRFTINSSTGALSFISAPNYESPTDADSNNSYIVTVTATNGAGSDSQIVTVNVQDVDENVAPTMPADTSLGINENTTAVGTFTALSGTAPITYSLSGVDAALFSINSSTGVVTFLVAPDFENPSDSGANNVYNLTVVATNSQGSDSQNITVNVLDLVDTPPQMPEAVAVNVNEGDTLVGTFEALSGVTPITYSLIGTDSGLFNINSSTGSVTFITTPDYESPLDSGANNIYNFTVVGTNSYGSDTQAVTVNIQNLAEDVPPTMDEDVIISVIEGGTIVGTFTKIFGSDPTTYSLSGIDSSAFIVNVNTGLLSFVTPPSFTVPVDSNQDNSYLVTVVAQNSEGTDSQNITVNVVKSQVFTSNSTTRASTSVVVRITTRRKTLL